jgi:peptide/nickel transport system substrate-binding protein
MDQNTIEEFKKSLDSQSRKEMKGKLRRLEGATLKHAHHFIVRRWRNLQEVRRSALGWVILVLVLSGAVLWQASQTFALYSQEIPSENTTYTEGVVGAVDNLNPIFASTQAERSASRLLFANLLRYDQKGDLVGELAQRWTALNEGKTYEVILRQNARWSDGEPITAHDVAYTFAVIKDADTKSPLYSGWRNIAVEAIDDRKVRFILPTPYAPFLHSLTIGILPRHMLDKIRTSELRNNNFNRSPNVTSGPFTFQDVRALDEKRTRFLVRMAANTEYVLGQPKAGRFHLHAYSDREQLVNAFRAQEVAAMSDIDTQQLESLGGTRDPVTLQSPLYNAVYAFLKMDSPILQDADTRHALVYATNRDKLIERLHGTVEPVAGPLLPAQIGYDSALRQSDVNHSLAAELLDKAGWKLNSEGRRTKDGEPLKLRLVTVNNGDYPVVAQEIMDQWSKLGISFESQLVRADDIQQTAIVPRAYDVLIYEIAIGKDPDVFAYWHSSQANDRGFNLSDYISPKADDALDSARSTRDRALRDAKYRTFAQLWLGDAPAVGLYRPSLKYIQTKNISSFAPHALVEQVDRYGNIRYWSSSKELGRPTL